MAVLIIRGRIAVAPPVETEEKAATALEAALGDCAGEPACVEATTSRFAALYQVADLCGKIDDPSGRDGCLLEVALRLIEPAICDEVADSRRAASCRDLVSFKQGRETGDLAACSRITTSEGLLEACTRRVVGERSDRGLCDPLEGRAREICLAVAISNQAVAAQDPGICDEIQDIVLRSICSGGGEGLAPPSVAPLEIPKPDTDGDGLSDEEEAALGTDPNNPDTDNDGLSDAEEAQKYKTDPLNPDTDADGFDDGLEVQSGFNPLGEGRL